MDTEIKIELKRINERLEKIEKAQGIFTTDLERDRGDLHDFTLELARLGAVVETVHKGQKNQVQKITNRMEETLEPFIDTTDELKEAVENKKVTLKVASWWHLWR